MIIVRLCLIVVAATWSLSAEAARIKDHIAFYVSDDVTVEQI